MREKRKKLVSCLLLIISTLAFYSTPAYAGIGIISPASTGAFKARTRTYTVNNQATIIFYTIWGGSYTLTYTQPTTQTTDAAFNTLISAPLGSISVLTLDCPSVNTTGMSGYNNYRWSIGPVGSSATCKVNLISLTQ